MTLELFRTLTPWMTLLALLILGIVGWFVRWMIGENNRRLNEFKQNLEDMENIIRELERTRQEDQKYIFEQYVDKKAFYIAVGKTEGLITRIFKQLNELNKSVNQIVGALNAGEKKIA
jgi:HAMP domain-containing protein